MAHPFIIFIDVIQHSPKNGQKAVSFTQLARWHRQTAGKHPIFAKVHRTTIDRILDYNMIQLEAQYAYSVI